MGKSLKKERAGEIIGFLTVLPYSEKIDGAWYWRVQCECGTQKLLKQSSLDGRTKSCGCKSKKNKGRNSNTSKYMLWLSLKSRCYSKNHDLYYLYGEKGATIVPRWFKYDNFNADTGERPERAMLIRKDDTKPFGPDNFEWQPVSYRYRGSRTNQLFEYKGESKTVYEWAKAYGIKPMSLYQRVFVRDMEIGEALTKPVIYKGGGHVKKKN